MRIAVRNAPTRFGPVSYTVSSAVAKNRIEATIQFPKPTAAKRIRLRLRHPEGKPVRAVTVQGQLHQDFEPLREVVGISSADPLIEVRAEYWAHRRFTASVHRPAGGRWRACFRLPPGVWTAGARLCDASTRNS